MESLSFSKTLHHSIFHLSQPPPPISPNFQTLKPSFPKTLTLTLTLTRASHKSPAPKTLDPLSSLLKPFILSLTAAAALSLFRPSAPSLASPLQPLPTPQSETLTLTLTPDERDELLLEQHLASNPNDVDSLRTLVQIKAKQQKFAEAISVVDRLISLDPSDLDLFLLKSHLHTYSGDVEKAREGFEEVLSASPFVVEAYHGLVMAASQARDLKELDGIVERVEGVMRRCEREKRREELRDLELLVAQVWIIEGKYEEALKMYGEMVKEEGRDFRPYLCRGIVYTLMRKMEEADESFRMYRKLVPKNHPYAQLFEKSLGGVNAAV